MFKLKKKNIAIASMGVYICSSKQKKSLQVGKKLEIEPG